jgi:phosphatidylglycerophosphate synthase
MTSPLDATAPTPPNPLPRRRQRGVLMQALAIVAALMPLAMGLSFALAKAERAAAPEISALLSGCLVALGAALVLWGLRVEFYPHDRFGLANAITLARGAGIAALAGLIVAPLDGTGWTIPILAASLLALDGLDGRVARKSGLQSRFGARFDMESDVAFALVLALLAWQADKVGLWFLLLGLLRPIYLGAARFWPLLDSPLPPSRRRRMAAGLQMAGQVLVLSPVLQPPLSSIVAGVLLAGMILSFAVDIRWQLQQGRRAE